MQDYTRINPPKISKVVVLDDTAVSNSYMVQRVIILKSLHQVTHQIKLTIKECHQSQFQIYPDLRGKSEFFT